MDLKTLSNRLGQCRAKYSQLGVHLGVNLDTIKTFECCVGNCERCLLEVLKSYVEDKSPDVKELCDALAKIGMKRLSDELQSKYQGT